MDDLKGKIVLITGASSGIGAGCAEEFAKYGCKLVLTGRDSNRLQRVAEKCTALNEEVEVFTVTGDLTKADDVTKIVESAVQKFGSINILINNAGQSIPPKTFEKSTMEDFDYLYDINVRSVLRITKLCLPYIIENKGNIINVSSVAGDTPVFYMLPYTMSKTAISQFTRCLALELAPKQVRVNGVSPGVILTDVFTRSGLCEPDKLEETMRKFSEVYPLGRVGEVGEVSKAIVFLASDAASFTTGHMFPIDGGRGIAVQPPAIN